MQLKGAAWWANPFTLVARRFLCCRVHGAHCMQCTCSDLALIHVCVLVEKLDAHACASSHASAARTEVDKFWTPPCQVLIDELDRMDAGVTLETGLPHHTLGYHCAAEAEEGWDECCSDGSSPELPPHLG